MNACVDGYENNDENSDRGRHSFVGQQQLHKCLVPVLCRAAEQGLTKSVPRIDIDLEQQLHHSLVLVVCRNNQAGSSGLVRSCEAVLGVTFG